MTQPSPSKKPVWISRGYKFKLDPTPAQADSLARHVGVCRVIYNLALEQRRDHYRQFKASTGKVISFASQCRELTLLRAEFDWIRSVGVTCQEQALRDLDTAFQGFFSGRGGYPQFRKRGVNDSFRFKGREVAVRRLNKSWGVVKLFKIGEVRFRWTRGIEGKVKAATINLDSLGWHVSFSTEAEADIEAGENPAIGIDRGVAQAVAYSDGSFAAFPKERIATLEAKVRRASAALSRCVKGSNRRKVAKARVAALRSRMARVRKHFNHVETTRVARSFSVVCIERLNTKGMTASARGTIEQPGVNVAQKSGLNRSILEIGWYQFQQLLAYKLPAAGGELRLVNPAYTSTTCSCCGLNDRDNRKSQAVYECAGCGSVMNADTNAAVNILQAGTRPAKASRQRKSHLEAPLTPDRESSSLAAGRTLTSKAVKFAPPSIDGEG
jgi:putative transposase